MNQILKNIAIYSSNMISIIKTRIIHIEIFIILLLSFTLLFLKYKINYDEINNILYSLITVTGIFSGIIISVLSIKLFNIKDKKEILFNEFYELSRKIMSFRRICFELKTSKRFWKTFDDIHWLEDKYKDISFNVLHSPSNSEEKAISTEFWLSEELEISQSKADLYLSIKQILNDSTNVPLWLYDKKIVKKNSIEYLSNALMPSNQIWYYLDHKYQKHLEGEISFEDLNLYETNQLQQHISELDPQYKNKEINRKLIAEIGSNFYENYIPRLIELTRILENTFPKSIAGLFISIIIIILIGVISPLIITFFHFNSNTIIIATSILIFLYTLGIIYFFYIFLNFIRNELRLI